MFHITANSRAQISAANHSMVLDCVPRQNKVLHYVPGQNRPDEV